MKDIQLELSNVLGWFESTIIISSVNFGVVINIVQGFLGLPRIWTELALVTVYPIYKSNIKKKCIDFLLDWIIIF